MRRLSRATQKMLYVETEVHHIAVAHDVLLALETHQPLVPCCRHTAERDEIIDRLRRAEPERWSYTALARALGCSRELIAQIVRRRR